MSEYSHCLDNIHAHAFHLQMHNLMYVHIFSLSPSISVMYQLLLSYLPSPTLSFTSTLKYMYRKTLISTVPICLSAIYSQLFLHIKYEIVYFSTAVPAYWNYLHLPHVTHYTTNCVTS